MPHLHLVLEEPYLGFLKEWGPLFVLDVCYLAFLYLEREANPVIPKGGVHAFLTLACPRPGLPGYDGPLGPQHIPGGVDVGLHPGR